jgi:hypothetical protein
MPYRNAMFWVAVFIGCVLLVCAGVGLLRMPG